VLSAVIFGTTAVTKAGKNAVQMQSYGSEARGGECQAEVTISEEEIKSPLADQMDLLVAMSQPALDKFLSGLRRGGTLIYDPDFVEKPDCSDVEVKAVPATQMASKLGMKLAANMVMLGYLQEMLQLFSLDDLLDVLAANVPSRFVEANTEAARTGARFASQGSQDGGGHRDRP
jgi:2-oxoglutarate ferredoxin oxidoreductase subunit gamma